MNSGRFTLNQYDWAKWGKNAAIFFAPALLILLVALQNGVPMHDALIAVYGWGLNTAVDLLRKFIQEG